MLGENETSVLEMNEVQKVDLELCASLTSVPGKVTAAHLECHLEAHAGQSGTWFHQKSFVKGRSCFAQHTG